MAHRPDAEIIATTHNTARFFTENRQISWVALLIVIAWGIYGYDKMPKRKDPDIPVKEAQVICAWPGVSADRVEQLVTRKIEQRLAEVTQVRAPSPEEYSIKSLTLDGLSVVNVQVDYNVNDTKSVFNEMDLKLRSITDLPKGAGPIQFFQRLWRYGGVDADGGESEGKRGCDLAARKGDRGGNKSRACGSSRSVQARDHHGCVPDGSRFPGHRRKCQREPRPVPVKERSTK